jgi:hypothetical protein
MKICSKCKKEKELTQFYKNSRHFKNPNKNKDRMSTVCKKCTAIVVKKNRIKNKDKYSQLTKNWILKNPEKRRIIIKKYWSSPKGIYRNLLKRGRSKVLISQKDFITWYTKQEKICVYCGIPENLVAKFNKGKLKSRLTIDRLEPKGNYEIDNIALACGICNMVKSDIFTPIEMSAIGNIIKNKWKKLT